MFTASRIFEIVLYALANFVPYLALSIYTFSNRLRFSKKITCGICVVAIAIQVVTRMWVAYTHSDNNLGVTLIRLFAYFVLFLVAIDARIGKILFIELIFSNIASFISITAICLESMFFTEFSHRLFCWHASLIMLALHLCITLPFSYAVSKKLKPMIDGNHMGKDWNYYWLVPVVFNVIWQFQLYGNDLSAIENVLNFRNTLYLLVVNLGAFGIYYIIILLSEQQMKNLELEQQNHYLDIEKLEYQALQERIERTRHARHDFRHHIIVMQDYLNHEEYDQLKEYLDTYQKTVPDTNAFLFCQNRAINRVLLFFATQARNNQIDFQVRLSIPETLKVSESDISVLLGNLLENALEACLEQKEGARRIIITGNGNANSLFFTIDNTCENEIRKNKKGEFLTTKPTGNGIGITSVKHIVERYHGVFSAEKNGNMFCVSFMLNL